MNRSSPSERTSLRRALEKATASLLLLTTTTSFAAPPVDGAAAGREQGAKDSASEGRSRGRADGQEIGKRSGYNQGYQDCSEQMRRDVIRSGERQGDIDGSVVGRDEGIARGEADGKLKGTQAGNADGIARADRQAKADATPKGTADGIAIANQSDSAARGTSDGRIAGNNEAKRDAEANEYSPARAQYKNERLAEPIQSENTVIISTRNETVAARALVSPSLATVSQKLVMPEAPASETLFASLLTTAEQIVVNDPPRREDRRDDRNVRNDRNDRNDPPIPDVRPEQAAENAIRYCKNHTSDRPSAPGPRSQLIEEPTPQPSDRPGHPSDRPIQPRPRPSDRPGPRPSGRPTPSPTPSPTVSPTPTPSPTPQPSPQATDFEKCVDDYRPAYEQSFVATFKSEYVAAWKHGFNQQFPIWRSEGCRVANQADYRPDYDAAHRRAYNDAYAVVFKSTYDEVYAKVFRDSFSVASAAAFDDAYDADYERHYEAAKSAAIQSRTGEIYRVAFNEAKGREYSARYSGYKAEVVRRARADEASEFQRTPVRLMGMKLEESVSDGILEPGEKLSVALDLRNFAETAISSRDLDLRAVARTSSGVSIPGAVTLLPRDLAPKSLTHVKGAFDIRLDESAVGKVVSVELQLSVRGSRLATETLSLRGNTLTRIELVETPVIRLGHPGVLRLRVVNQSSLALAENATISITTNMQGVVFEKTSEAVNGLQAGEAREVALPFKTVSATGTQNVSFAAMLNLASGRRIGLLNESREVASIQDYAFRVRNGLFDGDISNLRKSGKTRLVIFVKNTGQRKATESLTVTASVKGANAELFRFTKGNQASFSPLRPGEDQKQKIVVKVDEKNSGGTFVLEVREGGKLIGHFEEDF